MKKSLSQEGSWSCAEGFDMEAWDFVVMIEQTVAVPHIAYCCGFNSSRRRTR